MILMKRIHLTLSKQKIKHITQKSVIATGSRSYPTTGSQDGLVFANNQR